MPRMQLNEELNGVELYFDNKPNQSILNTLKSNGFRWSKFKKCWYAKQKESTLGLAEQIANNKIAESQQTESSNNSITKKSLQLLPLFDRLQFVEGSADTSKYNYKFVGSNYTGLTVKETAKIVRQHLRKQFPEVKFSVTSDYNSIDITIKSSPYDYKQMEYSNDIHPMEYRKFEEENNKEINAIIEYCNQLLSSYNYDDSDTMSDYFHKHFYKNVSIDYDYIQTEQTEAVKSDIINYRKKLAELEQQEQERQKLEFEEYQKQQKQKEIEYQKQQEIEKQQKEAIYNSIEIIELEKTEQYYVINSEFAYMNKNNTLNEYIEEVNKGDYNLQNVKVTKEIHFKNEESLNHFSNMLLHDFDFLSNTGGSYTEDARINSMLDYQNMDAVERETVEWLLYGVAIYYNNELQFVVDAQGYSYARYVGLTNNVKIQKTYDYKNIAV